MRWDKVLKRVEQRLKALGLSANAASDLGGHEDAIRNLRRNVKEGSPGSWNATTLADMATALQTTVGWLTEAEGREDINIEETTIPVWGRAGAGGKVYNFHDTAAIEHVPAPAGANENTGALEIVGDSLGTLFDRWLAIYDEVRDPPTSDLFGKLCVLELTDGRVYVKRLKKGRGKRFTLESNYDPPIYDVEVKWAARVKNLVAR